MKFRKNSGSKKREKSLEISRFLAVWLAKRLFPPLGFMAGIAGLEPAKRESKSRVLPLHHIPSVLCERRAKALLSALSVL